MSEPKTPVLTESRSVGASRQDCFTQLELVELLGSFDLKRGRYELDVGERGDIKFSRVKKEWIQREDLVT